MPGGSDSASEDFPDPLAGHCALPKQLKRSLQDAIGVRKSDG